MGTHVKKCSRGVSNLNPFFAWVPTALRTRRRQVGKSMGGRREREEILLGSTVDFLYIPQVVFALSLHAPCSVKRIVNLCCARKCADSTVFENP